MITLLPSALFVMYHHHQQNDCDKTKITEEAMKQALGSNQNVSFFIFIILLNCSDIKKNFL